MNPDAAEHLAVIEKRLGRLEQLINVVLERQEERAVKLERRIEFLSDKMEYSVIGLREYLGGVFLDEVSEEIERQGGIESEK